MSEKESIIKKLNNDIRGMRKIIVGFVFLAVPTLILLFTDKLAGADYLVYAKWLAFIVVGGNVIEHIPFLGKK